MFFFSIQGVPWLAYRGVFKKGKGKNSLDFFAREWEWALQLEVTPKITWGGLGPTKALMFCVKLCSVKFS